MLHAPCSALPWYFLHLHCVLDLGNQRGRGAVVAGVDLKRRVAAVPRHHVRQRGLAQACAPRRMAMAVGGAASSVPSEYSRWRRT